MARRFTFYTKLLFVTLLFFASPTLWVSESLATASSTSTTSSSLPSNQIHSSRQKAASEEENIDSFDVNPKSGRWNVTDTNTNDTIDLSNLYLNSTNTNSTSMYFAQRGLTKTDSSFEFRYRTNATSYTTHPNEWSVDYLNNVSNFNDGSTENFTSTNLANAGNAYASIHRSAGDIDFYRDASYDASTYKYLYFSYNTTDEIDKIDIRDGTATIICTNSTNQPASAYFVGFYCDLSAGAWSGTETRIQVTFDWLGVQDTTIFVDYLFLNGTGNIIESELGAIQQETFTLGLWDQDNDIPLMNISTYFWTYSSFQWRINLMDSSNNVVSYYYSSNQTSTEAYYRGKVTYNILESEFSVEIRSDSETRIFKSGYPGDFTNTGDVPQLFVHEKSPNIFFYNTPGTTTASSEVYIDFIKAPYKEHEWTQIYSSSDIDWLQDNWDHAYLQDDISGDDDNSTWRLVVPNLDALSGTLKIKTGQFGDYLALSTLDKYFVTFRIYVADWDTGTLQELAQMWVQVERDGSTGLQRQAALLFGNDTILVGIGDNTITYGDNLGNPSLSFSMKLEQDRSIISLDGLATLDSNRSTVDYGSGSIAIADFTSDASQEFVLEIEYKVFQFNGDTNVLMSFTDFDFVQKDILQGISNFIGDIVGGVEDIVEGGGNLLNDLARMIVSPLTGAFRTLITWLGGIINTIINGLQVALQLALTTLGALLDAAINALQPFLTLIETAVNAVATVVQDVVNEIIALAAGIISEIISGLSDVVTELVSIGLDVWNTIFSFVVDTLDPTEALGDSIDNLWTIDIATMLSDTLSAITFIASLAPFVVIFLVFFIFTLPFLMNNGDVFKGTAGVYKNATTSIKTPHMQLLGFGGQLAVPLILIVYILLKLMIAAGTFPDIFAGLPI